jgi:membrane protein
VSKYNAIYGSFAFLPLMLVWMQLSWLIALSGVVLTYSWQNFDSFAHREKVEGISPTYGYHLAVAVTALVTYRFKHRLPALTRNELILKYDIPLVLADRLLTRLQRAGLIIAVNGKNDGDKEDGDIAYHPACDPDDLTVNKVANALAETGESQFIAKTDDSFGKLFERVDKQRFIQQASAEDVRLLDLVKDGFDQKNDGKSTDIPRK